MIVMQKGRILADGAPSEIYSDIEMIVRAGLELPPLIELREKAGLPAHIMTAEDMAAELKRIKDR
jgi:energy-coupling factor transporter ATP-binding protein EcfA2